MFERFTDRARRVVVLAQEEARLLNHNYIGTEHVLLGLIHEREGVAARALTSLGISIEGVRNEVIEIIGRGNEAPSGHIPFTPRAKKVLEFSLREALQLGHDYIGTEHILLGVIREGEGVAAQALVKVAGRLDRVRERVIEMLPGAETVVATSTMSTVLSAPPVPVGLASARTCGFCGRDSWDVDRYVEGAGALVCDECVTAAHAALDVARATGHDERAVTLPRGFGDPPPPPEEIAEIEAALLAGFAGDADHVEDGPRLAPLRERARAARPGVTARHVIQRVRLLGPDRAEFRYVIVVEPGNGRYLFEGRAIREGGRWKVARETVLAQLRLAGITPDEP